MTVALAPTKSRAGSPSAGQPLSPFRSSSFLLKPSPPTAPPLGFKHGRHRRRPEAPLSPRHPLPVAADVDLLARQPEGQRRTPQRQRQSPRRQPQGQLQVTGDSLEACSARAQPRETPTALRWCSPSVRGRLPSSPAKGRAPHWPVQARFIQAPWWGQPQVAVAYANQRQRQPPGGQQERLPHVPRRLLEACSAAMRASSRVPPSTARAPDRRPQLPHYGFPPWVLLHLAPSTMGGCSTSSLCRVPIAAVAARHSGGVGCLPRGGQGYGRFSTTRALPGRCSWIWIRETVQSQQRFERDAAIVRLE